MFTMCHSALQYTRHLELILTRDDPLGVSVQPSSDLALGATSRGSMRSARVSSPSFATPAASVSASDDDPRYALAAADAARAALRALAAEALWTRDEALRARDEAEADAEALRARLAETREALIERDAEATSLRRKVRLLLRRAEANAAGRRARLPDADAREEHDHVEALAAAEASSRHRLGGCRRRRAREGRSAVVRRRARPRPGPPRRRGRRRVRTTFERPSNERGWVGRGVRGRGRRRRRWGPRSRERVRPRGGGGGGGGARARAEVGVRGERRPESAGTFRLDAVAKGKGGAGRAGATLDAIDARKDRARERLRRSAETRARARPFFSAAREGYRRDRLLVG